MKASDPHPPLTDWDRRAIEATKRWFESRPQYKRYFDVNFCPTDPVHGPDDPSRR